jgi:hypothetical protein
MSIHAIHVNSCHSGHFSLDFLGTSVKWGEGGRGVK